MKTMVFIYTEKGVTDSTEKTENKLMHITMPHA